MNCPFCGSEEARAAECVELTYEVAEDRSPADLINGEDLFEGPTDHYYVCAECDRRWDREGHALVPPKAVPSRT